MAIVAQSVEGLERKGIGNVRDIYVEYVNDIYALVSPSLTR
jgi:hypothetical protein